MPELDVRDFETSLDFWCSLLGFQIAYDRPEDGFAFLERRDADRTGAQVMLCRANETWSTAPLDPPLARGVNFQLIVAAIDPILNRLQAASWPLFRAPHDAWYRIDREEVGLRQFLVQDPDGYLLRFAETIGTRSLSPDGPASPR